MQNHLYINIFDNIQKTPCLLLFAIEAGNFLNISSSFYIISVLLRLKTKASDNAVVLQRSIPSLL